MAVLHARRHFVLSLFILLTLFNGCHSNVKKVQSMGISYPVKASDTIADPPAIIARASALEGANKQEDAIGYITVNLHRFKGGDKAMLLNERGNAYFLKDDFENALVDYLAVVDIDPQNPVYLFNVAKAYKELESLDNAIFFAQKIVDLNTISDSDKVQARNLIEQCDQIHTGR